MRVRIYAGLVISPISFPDQFEILIFPLNRETNQPLGGNFPMIEHHSLEWARNQYPLGEEDEKELRAGRRVNVFTGYVVGEFPDEVGISRRRDDGTVGLKAVENKDIRQFEFEHCFASPREETRFLSPHPAIQ